MIRGNMNLYKMMGIIIFTLLLIPIAYADNVTPPVGVRIAGYITTHDQIGVWWMNPVNESDYDGIQIYFNDISIGNKSNTTIFYNAEFLTPGNYTFSTRTFDLYGNLNTTWVNITIFYEGYYICKEDWFCADYCGIFVPEKTPIDPWNITQGQQPTQSAKQYSDISIWYAMLIITIGCLIASRNLDIKTIRPILLATISFISSIALTYTSLSIAVIGSFAKGTYIDYINQTNSATFYYQVIMVETRTWITALCITITIIVILNGVDIILRYIEKSREIDTNQENNKWKI